MFAAWIHAKENQLIIMLLAIHVIGFEFVFLLKLKHLILFSAFVLGVGSFVIRILMMGSFPFYKAAA